MILNKKYCQSTEVVQASIDDEVVMMSIEQGAYYGLDDIASRIWSLLENPRSISELCETLVAEYEIDEPQCIEDVTHFLNQMETQGIITRAD